MGPSPWDQGSSGRHLLDANRCFAVPPRHRLRGPCQLHFDDPATPLDETLEALDVIVRYRKARYVGVSNILPIVSPAPSAVPTYSASHASSPFSRVTTCCSVRSSASCYRSPRRNPGRHSFQSPRRRPSDRQRPARSGARQGTFSAEVGSSAATVYQEAYWHERQFATVEKLGELAKRRGVPYRRYRSPGYSQIRPSPP